MVKSDAMANQLVEQARLEFAHPGLEFMTASVGDTGAIIEEISIPTESLPVYTEFA
jgi:hypothetical protein